MLPILCLRPRVSDLQREWRQQPNWTGAKMPEVVSIFNKSF